MEKHEKEYQEKPKLIWFFLPFWTIKIAMQKKDDLF